MPTVATTYSVISTASNGYTGFANLSGGIHPLPIVSVLSSAASSTVCMGESVVLTGQGLVTNNYYWNGGLSVGYT